MRPRLQIKYQAFLGGILLSWALISSLLAFDAGAAAENFPNSARCWKAFGAIARNYQPGASAITYDTLPTGIEWEGLRPPTINLRRLITLLSQELEGRGIRIDAIDPETHTLRFRRGNEVYLIEVKNENFWKDDEATEIVSPILRNASDRQLFLDLIGRLPALGLRELPDHAGVHFHFDFNAAAPAEILVLLRAWSLVEKEVMSRAGVRAARMSYNNPVLPRVENLLRDLANGTWNPSQMDAFTSLMSYFRDETGRVSRQFSLNLDALTKHGTVEFRFMNSTTNSVEIARYHRFTGALVAAVRRRDPLLLDWLARASQGEHATVENLAQALGVPAP